MNPQAQVTAVRFTHAGYKWSLMIFLGVMFLLNSLALMVGVKSSLVPVVIQGALLWLIVGNHRRVRLLVQVWCGVLVITGLYGVVSRMLEAEINTVAMTKDVVVGVLAAYFLVYAGRYIEEVRK